MVVLDLGQDDAVYVPTGLKSSLGDLPMPAATRRMIRTVKGSFRNLQTRGRRW